MLPFSFASAATIDIGCTQFENCVVLTPFGPYKAGSEIACIEVSLLDSRIHCFNTSHEVGDGIVSWKGNIELKITK